MNMELILNKCMKNILKTLLQVGLYTLQLLKLFDILVCVKHN